MRRSAAPPGPGPPPPPGPRGPAGSPGSTKSRRSRRPGTRRPGRSSACAVGPRTWAGSGSASPRGPSPRSLDLELGQLLLQADLVGPRQDERQEFQALAVPQHLLLARRVDQMPALTALPDTVEDVPARNQEQQAPEEPEPHHVVVHKQMELAQHIRGVDPEDLSSRLHKHE